MSIPGRQPIRSDDDSALAKSLPMRVPAMSNYHSQDIDIEDDRVIIITKNLSLISQYKIFNVIFFIDSY